jgi:phosphoribosylformimino-5-aminoimidazole carboxamide ribotide isomerase
MRLIGVVDLLAGRAVHARGGIREHYVPVRAVAGSVIDGGDPLALARAYVDRFGLAELYAADLDAILAGAPRDVHTGAKAGRPAHNAIVRDLATLAPLWLDAGVSSAEDARHALSLGATRAIIGLETLGSFDALAAICDAVGNEHVAFSLDLRKGEPVAPRLGMPPGEPAHLLAARAADAGVGAVIVIDLARVGIATGLDFDLIARVRAAAPGQILLAGGGVRGLDDLARLADAGCDGALVASALHDGALSGEDIVAVQQLGGHRSATR